MFGCRPPGCGPDALFLTFASYSIDGRRIGSLTASTPSLVDLRSVDIHLGQQKNKEVEVLKDYELFHDASKFRKGIDQC